MSIFRKIDKVLANFGNIRALQRTHVDTYTENLIQNIAGEKVAESFNGQLWVDFQELAGHKFLEATILSRENIKTYNGAQLILIEKNNLINLKSDITEIESDYSNISNQWMTKVNFIVSTNNINYVKSKKAEKIKFEYKKKVIEFNVIK